MASKPRAPSRRDRRRRIEKIADELRDLKAQNVGLGQPTAFTGKGNKVTMRLTDVAVEAIDEIKASRKYRSASDAVEYALRKVTRRPSAGTLEDPLEANP